LNLPNILTFGRFFLAAGFVIFISRDGLAAQMAGGGFFLLAAATDWLDGYIARKYRLVTSLGKILDPVADKFLTLSAFFVFARMGIVPWWMCVVIAIREAGLTALRLWALGKGKVLAAETLGKYKTVLQMTTIGVVIIFLIVRAAGGGRFSVVPEAAWRMSIYALMAATVFLTVFSGITHYCRNREAYRV
jgi:CDP-diacylglycerol--glycerol-3-phosphate 3-phosphatidyltransferase